MCIKEVSFLSDLIEAHSKQKGKEIRRGFFERLVSQAFVVNVQSLVADVTFITLSNLFVHSEIIFFGFVF